ncbi:MAG: hypothetical protein NC339_02730 [Muribaculaceae bacterium]|nr:hypothetical protein [Muribaculaceae bacterium]
MSSIKIAAILRAASYSPNHIGNDAAILNLTCEQLRKRGCEVRTYSEEQLIAGAVGEEYVIHMCRDRRSFPILQQMEDDGRLVVNSGYGVENCVRERMARILIGSGIPYPESIMVDTNQTVASRLDSMGISRAWIKKGEMYACHKEDVTYVRHSLEAQEMLQEYFLRGIRRAVINRHIDGVKLKFYGVTGTPWFYHSFPLLSPPEGPGPEGFDLEAFKDTCAHAAEALDIIVYGGDAIVSPDGSFTIIDVNDWPTFAPCRNEASAVIARKVLSLIKARL